MIVSDLIKIKKIKDISVEYIENEIKKQNISPLRWAIVNAEEDLVVSLTYERK